MNKWKDLLLIVLALLNVGLLGLIWVKSEKTPKPAKENYEKQDKRHNRKGSLEKDLNFNEDQVEKMQALKRTHKNKLYTLMRELKHHETQLFRKYNSVTDREIDSIALITGKIRSEIERMNIRHFKEMRTICETDEQRQKFDTLISKVGRRMHKGWPPHHNGSYKKKGERD